jgi:hypothetical protein
MDLAKFLTGGRKSQLTVVGLIIVVAMGIWRDLPVETIVEYVTYLVAVGAGSIALEDGLSHIRKGRPDNK